MSAIRSIILTMATAILASSNASALELSFGLYVNDKATELVKEFRPLLDSIEKVVGNSIGEPTTIQMRVARSYAQGIDDIVKGRVDFARFGPASYVEAKARQNGITIIAMETLRGKKTFSGIICVKETSSIRELSDLRGKRVAFGSLQSTIGRYLAQDLLISNGIFAKDLSGYEYLGRHDKVGEAVADGSFDAGALKEDTFKELLDRGLPLRILAEFQNVTKPWLGRADLPAATVKALRDALLRISDFSSLDEADGFALGEDTEYQPIRAAMERSARFTDAPEATPPNSETETQMHQPLTRR